MSSSSVCLSCSIRPPPPPQLWCCFRICDCKMTRLRGPSKKEECVLCKVFQAQIEDGCCCWGREEPSAGRRLSPLASRLVRVSKKERKASAPPRLLLARPAAASAGSPSWSRRRRLTYGLISMLHHRGGIRREATRGGRARLCSWSERYAQQKLLPAPHHRQSPRETRAPPAQPECPGPARTSPRGWLGWPPDVPGAVIQEN